MVRGPGPLLPAALSHDLRGFRGRRCGAMSTVYAVVVDHATTNPPHRQASPLARVREQYIESDGRRAVGSGIFPPRSRCSPMTGVSMLLAAVVQMTSTSDVEA